MLEGEILEARQESAFLPRGLWIQGGCRLRVQVRPGARGNNLGFRPSNGANVNLPRARVSSLVCNPAQKRLSRAPRTNIYKGSSERG